MYLVELYILCAALDTFGARKVKKGLHISARIKSIVLNGDIKGHLMKHSQNTSTE